MALTNNRQLTSNNHYAIALLEQAESNGIDTHTLLQHANIQAEQLRHTNSRIEVDKIAALVQFMWHALKDENLGLSRHKCPPGSFYTMGMLTIHQPNLQKALALGFHFYNRYIPGYTLSLLEQGDHVHLRIDQQDPQLDPKHLLTELILMAWHRYSSWLIGENIPLHETHFSYSSPIHADDYKFIFPSQHCFDQAYSGLSFNKHYLLRPNIQDEKSLKLFMASCPSSFFLKHEVDNSLSNQVRQLIHHHVVAGLPTIDEIAATLAMTTQTLRRKLKLEGSSYQQIKDLLRRDQALYYLSQLNLPIAEVATLTGFSEASVFIRAFKKWTGMSPSNYRNIQNNS